MNTETDTLARNPPLFMHIPRKGACAKGVAPTEWPSGWSERTQGPLVAEEAEGQPGETAQTSGVEGSRGHQAEAGTGLPVTPEPCQCVRPKEVPFRPDAQTPHSFS